ncbi:hypothetical protein PoB_000319200 [Plakobranchus ocellatus]|uniref:Uncharacterized protein n=1 Tax=Plakobranchus ocellatus TaxID=259542 RepID=A0AAV3Y3N0_9GAST|nr:hypothetical protein PoB_000319200 [Plakobranchus ocellatus]
MRKAMVFIFPDAGYFYMQPTFASQLCHYLNDKIGLPQGPTMRLLPTLFGDNGLVHSPGEVAFETRLELVYREMQKTAPEFISYFKNHFLGEIRDNLAVSQLSHLTGVIWPWTNKKIWQKR